MVEGEDNMPIYEYECKKCEYTFEELQSIHDKALTKCPECGAKKSLKKLISTSAIKFKGDGWTPKFHN